MMLDENMDVHKGIKSTKNFMWVNIKEFYVFFKISFKDNFLLWADFWPIPLKILMLKS